MLLASVILAMLPACGPPKEAADPTSGSSSATSTAGEGEGEAKSGEAKGGEEAAKPSEAAGGEAAKPQEAKPAPAAQAEPSEAEVLARDFLKSGGRRIGYSESKKGFAYPLEQRSETGMGLDVQFAAEDGTPRDRVRVCQIGECEENLNDIVKELMPKLSARLQSEGYTAIRGIGWPQGRDELEVSTLSMKLKYTKGKLEALREGKPAVALKQAGGKRIDATTLLAIFIVPGGKLLGVLAPPGADAKGLVQEFYVFKLP
jgi:hypothetical protein